MYFQNINFKLKKPEKKVDEKKDISKKKEKIKKVKKISKSILSKVKSFTLKKKD